MDGTIMSDSLLNTQPVKDLLRKVSGLDNDSGDARLKRIVHRVVSDLFRTIEEFDVQPDEFWSAMSYLTSLGQANETGLLVPPSNPAALASAIRQIVEQRELRQRLIAAAEADVRERFTWDRVLPQYRALLHL